MILQHEIRCSCAFFSVSPKRKSPVFTNTVKTKLLYSVVPLYLDGLFFRRKKIPPHFLDCNVVIGIRLLQNKNGSPVQFRNALHPPHSVNGSHPCILRRCHSNPQFPGNSNFIAFHHGRYSLAGDKRTTLFHHHFWLISFFLKGTQPKRQCLLPRR